MNLVFLGPPGAGKGTLAAKVEQSLGIPAISTGAIFRSQIALGSPLGLKVKSIIGAGKLVDDDTTIELITERLSQPDVRHGFVLDGFPRTIPQAEALSRISTIHTVFDFDIPDPVIIERLSGRRVCKSCGKTYHIISRPPKKEGFCDDCGSPLYIREDDAKEAVQKRLEVYRAQTAPLIEYYKEQNLLVVIDARPPTEEVFTAFMKARKA